MKKSTRIILSIALLIAFASSASLFYMHRKYYEYSNGYPELPAKSVITDELFYGVRLGETIDNLSQRQEISNLGSAIVNGVYDELNYNYYDINNTSENLLLKGVGVINNKVILLAMVFNGTINDYYNLDRLIKGKWNIRLRSNEEPTLKYEHNEIQYTAEKQVVYVVEINGRLVEIIVGYCGNPENDIKKTFIFYQCTELANIKTP